MMRRPVRSLGTWSTCRPMSRLQWRRCDFTAIAIAPRAVLGGCEVELFTFELKRNARESGPLCAHLSSWRISAVTSGASANCACFVSSLLLAHGAECRSLPLAKKRRPFRRTWQPDAVSHCMPRQSALGWQIFSVTKGETLCATIPRDRARQLSAPLLDF